MLEAELPPIVTSIQYNNYSLDCFNPTPNYRWGMVVHFHLLLYIICQTSFTIMFSLLYDCQSLSDSSLHGVLAKTGV